MAENPTAGERTEPPTPRKREEARKKGQVPRSQDLNTAVILLSACLLVYFLAGTYVDELTRLQLRVFAGLGSERVTMHNVAFFGAEGAGYLVRLLLPLAGVLLIIGFAVNLVQVGFLVTFEPITPKASRLNPLKGFARIFSRRGFVRLLFGLLKLTVVSAVLVHGMRDLFAVDSSASLFGVFNLPLWEVVDFSNQALFSLGVRAATALLLLALFDLFFQRMQHERDLMMTKQEVRDELKRMEGDPKLKERRRRIQQRLALQRMMLDVPKADVVITNPVHLACAIQYQPATMTAPRLLAKGKGYLAHRIRETAVRNNIPVVEEPPIARLVYDTTEVGDEIPPNLYKPVAEILAYVYRLGSRREAAGVA